MKLFFNADTQSEQMARGGCMQMITNWQEDENTSIPLQQGEVEDVYLLEENVNCDAFGRLS